MKYLVQIVSNELFPTLEGPAVAETVRKMVLPSLDILSQWNKDGKISGGVAVGQRAGAFVIEAASTADLDKSLRELPFWGMMRMTVTPLVDFAERRAAEDTLLNQAGK